jgi:two-component system, response regulator PdtaR
VNTDSDCQQRPCAIIVDDEPLIRMCTADYLTELGFDVLEAGSGDEAMTLMSLHYVNLIITDHRMPGMTGTELADAVATTYPETTVIIASGALDACKVETSRIRLSKPYTFNDLLDAVTKSNIFQAEQRL